jgi:hypothetical protein
MPDFDIFDYLASTFPIEDWITRARSRYDTLERRVPETSPRMTIPRADAAGSEVDDTWTVPTSYCLRRLRWASHSPAVVDDPCAALLDRAGERPELPEHPDIESAASLELGPETD